MRSLLPLAAVCAVILAGCGETEIDSAKAESFISDTISEQVGARVQSVECPDGLVAKKGETFECKVTGDDGSTGQAVVTEKDDEGNVNVNAPFLHVRNLEAEIVEGLQSQIEEEVELDCPEIVTGEQGATFECEATNGQGTATILVTQKDDQGNVRYELQQ